MIMFNYAFPIFAFGLLITGIVYLGILQTAAHLKADSDSARENGLDARPLERNPGASSNQSHRASQ